MSLYYLTTGVSDFECYKQFEERKAYEGMCGIRVVTQHALGVLRTFEP